MKKRILTALVVLCLAACLAPLSAFATSEGLGGEKTKITSLTITVDKPQLTKNPVYAIGLNHFTVTANTDNIKDAVTVSSDNGNNYVDWFRCSSSSYKGDKTDVWEPESSGHITEVGYYYRMRAILTPTADYEFDENITCTVNDVTCTATYEDIYQSSNKVVVNYIIEPLHYDDENYTVVTSATATLTEPVIGQIPAAEVTASSSTPEGGAKALTLSWAKMSVADYDVLKNWDIDTHADTEEPPRWSSVAYNYDDVNNRRVYTEAFQAGYVYGVKLTFFRTGNYMNRKILVLDEDFTATINGKEYKPSSLSAESADFYLYYLTPSDVTRVDASITEPKLGAAPDTAPTCTSNPADSVTLKEVRWHKIAEAEFTGTNADRWTQMTDGEKFTTGYYYAAELFYAPKDGCIVSRDVTGTINGKPHDGTYCETCYIGDAFDGVEEYADKPIYISTVFAPLTESAAATTTTELIAPATDDGNSAVWLVLALTSGAGLALLCFRKKRSISK